MIRVDLPRFDRFDAWRQAARQLASAGIRAEDILWVSETETVDLFGGTEIPPPGPHQVRVTKDFLSRARAVGFHSAPERWTLLYRALLKLQVDRAFWENPADPLMIRLNRLSKSVRRDIHKMHAFVRFHEMDSAGPRRRFAAWFEPEHPILQAATPFFAKRFADMDWMIATPEGTAHFDGELRFSDSGPRPDLPPDASHQLWQTYFANIFNPARIKIKAMQSEMPVKYWKNLPETQLISEMLADAPRRVRAMTEAGASQAPAFAEKVTARIRIPMPEQTPQTLGDARAQALACTRCALCQPATQTVWGEGSPTAALMIVGEAPGDQEDLAGHPFIGPAGQLLHRLMAKVGIDPNQVWLTNAVKHFKFTSRGKRRLHQNPNGGEISHCRWWLDLERRFIAPRLTVALGASAAFSLTGNRAALTDRRGQMERAIDGGKVLITWHPSLVLRLTGKDKQLALHQLQSDLQMASQVIRQ